MIKKIDILYEYKNQEPAAVMRKLHCAIDRKQNYVFEYDY